MSTNLSVDAKPWIPGIPSQNAYNSSSNTAVSNQANCMSYNQEQSQYTPSFTSSFSYQQEQQQQLQRQHNHQYEQEQQYFQRVNEQSYTPTPSFPITNNIYSNNSNNGVAAGVSSVSNTYLSERSSYKIPDVFAPELRQQSNQSLTPQHQYNLSSAPMQPSQHQLPSQRHLYENSNLWPIHKQQQQQQQQLQHQHQQQHQLLEQEQMSQPKFNPNAAKLFIGQLPYECTEEQLRRLFEPYGTVEHIHFLRDNNNRSKGAAFLTYSIVDEADTAIFTLHNRYRMLTNRAIQVSYSKHSPSISSFGTYSAEEVHNSNPTNPVPDVVLNNISMWPKQSMEWEDLEK